MALYASSVAFFAKKRYITSHAVIYCFVWFVNNVEYVCIFNLIY